jgi:bisphosphoglycerate-independent phosphoglycerate mutase (AlkP superfamily)
VKVSELRKEMHQLSGEMKAQFAEVSERFAEVDRRFEQVDQRFEHVDREIARQAEATRRHFDIIAEQIKSDYTLLATGIADLARRFDESRSERQTVTRILDVHELRLKTLERRRSR